MRARLAFLILGTAALGGCAYGYGGYGSPYSGLSVGIGYSSGYGGYGRYGYDPFCRGYGYGGYSRYGGCADPYWGWYGGYYYPGTGYYVYDRYRRPYRWSDAHRRYWSERRERAQSTVGTEAVTRPNWGDFTQQQDQRRAARVEQRQNRQADRVERSQVRTPDQQLQRSTRSSVPSTAAERRSERRSQRESRRNARDD